MAETLKSGFSSRSKMLLTLLIALIVSGVLLGVAGGLRHSGVIGVGSTESMLMTGASVLGIAIVALLLLGMSVTVDMDKQKKIEVPAETDA